MDTNKHEGTEEKLLNETKPEWAPLKLEGDRPLNEREVELAAFRKGERIPYRGIVWAVGQVNLKTVVLVPLGPTKRIKRN